MVQCGHDLMSSHDCIQHLNQFLACQNKHQTGHGLARSRWVDVNRLMSIRNSCVATLQSTCAHRGPENRQVTFVPRMYAHACLMPQHQCYLVQNLMSDHVAIDISKAGCPQQLSCNRHPWASQLQGSVGSEACHLMIFFRSPSPHPKVPHSRDLKLYFIYQIPHVEVG